MDTSQKVKLVAVGDGAVGKGCMFKTFVYDVFPEEYVPLINDVFSKSIEVDGVSVDLTLCYTAGQEDYDRLRPMCYPQTDVFLVLYSVVLPTSHANTKQKWVPELQEHTSGVPFILVGTQTDLREDESTLARLAKEGMVPFSNTDGEKVAASLGAVKYTECSARTREGLNEVFEEAVRVALAPEAAPAPRKHKCVIM